MPAFVYKTVFTLGDTNVFQNVYFSNHLKLTGIVRELWGAQHVANFPQHLATGLKIITKNAACEYLQDFFAFDAVRVEMVVKNLKRASCDLEFKLFHDTTGELHAKAQHTIVFADAQHKICAMPEDFAHACGAFGDSIASE